MFKLLKKLNALFIATIFFLSLCLHINVKQASAAVTNPTGTAKVSFTFDDGLQSSYTLAAPTLKKYGFTATNFVTTGCIGMTTIPNTCRANTDARYMTWAQVKALQSTYGWEIGSHTVTHPYLATSDASDGQPNVLTQAQVTSELTGSKAALAAQGINAKAFATPYGDYNAFTLSEIAKYYTTHRGFADVGYNSWPYSEYYVLDQHVEGSLTVANVKAYVDYAIANNKWLVLTFHDIKLLASSNNDDYEYGLTKLDQIAAYIKSKNVPVTNMSSNTVTSDTNIVGNGSFNIGLGGGWTTDSPTLITADTAGHGNSPDVTNSIKFVSGSKSAHLYSPKISVANGTNYLIKNYLNMVTVTNGEIGFYIDEYDVNGNWVSGQWKTRNATVFAQNINFAYSPSSANVKLASLQVYMTANSGILGYLDNVEWFALNQPTTPPPVQTNLLPNGTFDSGSTNWTNDSPTTITIDSTNNGSTSNPVNSMKLVSLSSANKHLFSSKVAVISGGNYSISNYLKISQISSGEIGYYIDEYDINGNWISGQYKGGNRAVGVFTNNMSYTPSSANVKSASVQVIVTGGTSNIVAYFDNATWYLN